MIKLLKWAWALSGAAAVVSCNAASDYPLNSPEHSFLIRASLILLVVWATALLFHQE